METVYREYAADPRKQRAWSGENPGNHAIRDELAEAVLPFLPDAGVVLDVGCGAGWWLARLASTGVAAERLAGVDLQDARAQVARRRIRGSDVRTGDCRTLPFGDDSLGAVTLFTVLSSLASDADRRRTISEARRVVVPGGPVIVWEPRMPTGNRQTAPVSLALLRDELGAPLEVRTLTLLPPLARRLPGRAYPVLARVPLLRSHRLAIGRA